MLLELGDWLLSYLKSSDVIVLKLFRVSSIESGISSTCSKIFRFLCKVGVGKSYYDERRRAHKGRLSQVYVGVQLTIAIHPEVIVVCRAIVVAGSPNAVRAA